MASPSSATKQPRHAFSRRDRMPPLTPNTRSDVNTTRGRSLETLEQSKFVTGNNENIYPRVSNLRRVGISSPAVSSRFEVLDESSLSPSIIDAENHVQSDADTRGGHSSYNRKDKSLGLLCENFLNLYGTEEGECISLDEAASSLGVERRRIYDIVNVLESVEILIRKAKNRYTWHGFTRLPEALQRMKEAALRDYGLGEFSASASIPEERRETNSPNACGSSDNEDEERKVISSADLDGTPLQSQQDSAPKGKADCRREKSLGLLSQKFVQLFLVSQTQVVSLEDAARLLLGDSKDASKLKTKVRRLYDIANILSSLQLIEKTHMTENRKPAFRWLGTKDDLVGPATRKRMSGASKTNEPLVPNSLERSKRVLKRVSGNDVLGEQNPPKRTALKPLQPRCPNTLTPYPRDVINKPVPLYPRTPQPDSSATGLSSPKPMPPVTPEATAAPPAPIGGTSGTSGWREWNDNAQTTVVPTNLGWSLQQCCENAGRVPSGCSQGAGSAACTPNPCQPAAAAAAVAAAAACCPGMSIPTIVPMTPRSCCSCQRGPVENFYPFMPRLPGPMFNPFLPPFPMHPHLAGAGLPCIPGPVPEQFLGSDQSRAHDCSMHRAENGVAAAAALQYQNETLGHMFAQYVDTWKSWYLQAASMASPPCFEGTPPPEPTHSSS